jgi:hypothetical protein
MSAQLSCFQDEAPPVQPARRSVRDHIDELIDWYARFKPDTMTIQVNCRPSTLRKFCRKNGKRGGPWIYRERVIVPTLKPRRVAE